MSTLRNIAREQLLPRLLCYLGLVLTTSCASIIDLPELQGALEKGQVDPHRVVFICHGMMKDLGSQWDRKLQREIHQERALGIAITYWSEPTGVIFNWGCAAPGDLIAQVADEIERLHRTAGSGRELTIDAIGFSHGCEAILHAASRMKNARFRRVAFISSSSFAFSQHAAHLIQDGKIQTLRNYWSPIDITTFFAPIGAGQFGLHARDPAVSNEMILMPHVPYLIGSSLRKKVRAFILKGSAQNPRKSEFSRSLAEYLDSLAD